MPPPDHAADAPPPHESPAAPLAAGVPGLLAAVARDAREGVLITTAELDAPGPIIVYANAAEARLTGYAVEELVGRTPRILQGPATSRAVLDALRVALGRGEAFSAETINYRRDGTPYLVAWQITPVRDAGGTITHWVSVQRDVTEERATEQALRDSEARLRLTLDAVQEAVWDWDVASDTVLWSARLTTLLGVEPAAAASAAAFTELVHPDDRAELRSMMELHLDGTLPAFSSEFRVRHQDERWLWVLSRGQVVERDAAGAPRRMLGALGDISARKAAEAALVASEARFRTMFDQAGLGLARTSFDGRWLEVNRRVCEITGRSREELLGRSWHDITHPDDVAACRAALQAVAAEATAGTGVAPSFALEKRYLRPDGRPVLVRIAGTTLQRNGRTPEGFLIALDDITERRELEHRLRQAQKMEAVGLLAGGVAHDFNNLLTVIQGNLEFAQRALPDGSPVAGDLAEVNRAAERAAGLVRQLLAFSRKQILRAEVLDCSQVVRTSMGILRRLVGEDIAIVTRLAPDLWPVRADRSQLEQVLVNLTVNARDAIRAALDAHAAAARGVTDAPPAAPPRAELELTTANVTLDAAAAAALGLAGAGDHVRLQVRDTGIGIEPALLPQIFEPFFTTKPLGAGTGLGLATVWGIVSQSGGTVTAASTPGDGTTITVHLPRAAAASALAAGRGPAAAPGSGLVLLVEDEAPVRRTIARMLGRAGYQVLEAAHGGEALALWREHRARLALIVSDLRMPAMSGEALDRQLRAEGNPVPLLFMTGHADRLEAQHLQRDDVAVLEKPFTADELLAAVAGRMK